MQGGKRPSGAAALRNVAFAVLLVFAAVVLTACSGLAAPDEQAAAKELDPAYKQRIADHLKSIFKDYTIYDSFEISDPRWVHALPAWSWIACVRFNDRGRTRTYAVFLRSDKIIDSRYAVETDACGTQAYAPFEQLRGGLAPLH